ncbi:Mob1/phocein [Polyplosphaeria fusca]|uniref:Mob1/phocein n=1 Tax=Polyplosphaeria fusca TaxID=682080 RepID=A0A9P4V2H0_9PLEO|nr:Mob1/phocein [Polyplosphaeria fusca]
MTASARSPASSPRLPSPPPIAEDQLGPKSPLAGPDEQQKLFERHDNNADRRIRPGTKATDMAEGPPFIEYSQIQSSFPSTEYLKSLHSHLTHPPNANATSPINRELALMIAQPPAGVDKTLWLYELCRFLTQKVNTVIIALFADSPPCSSMTCPEMRASEWQYLCAVHDPPKSCCAIDYCCHTLDWAANILTNQKNFPSRIAMGNDANLQHSQIRLMTNIFRRVYRIFAHAWFQHREVFWKVEGRTGLYVLFKTVCDAYGLIPEDNYTIPPAAEGVEPTETTPVEPPLILKREPSDQGPQEETSLAESMGDHTLSTAGTTKRHRHSPSVGATAVATVVEENEEEEEQHTQEDEDEDAESPVALSMSPEAEREIDTPESSEPESSEPESSEPAEDVKVAETADGTEPRTGATWIEEAQRSTDDDEAEEQGASEAEVDKVEDAKPPETSPHSEKEEEASSTSETVADHAPAKEEEESKVGEVADEAEVKRVETQDAEAPPAEKAETDESINEANPETMSQGAEEKQEKQEDKDAIEE